MLSMRLAAVNPRIDFNFDTLLASENGSLMDGSFNGTAMQLAWPHQVTETEQSFHHRQLQLQQPPQPQQWPYDGLNQPAWGREDDQGHGNEHNSLMVGSASLHPNQVKMELDPRAGNAAEAADAGPGAGAPASSTAMTAVMEAAAKSTPQAIFFISILET
ncbi:hypothetical protein F2Q68_00041706 [Brassica cretica]|uniref:Uncharacterized protein n=1 Tax=Brassica cretica TaxID=69181 RepID=A0A8S9MQN2_BRACR|nr:hypothetical protein F2Q68_00041706 [Brassica cretica]